MPEGFVVEDIIAITGHRVYPDRASLFRGLDQLQARTYLFGGAQGIDTDALEYIAKTQPHSLRTVIVPNRLVDQPSITIPITKKYSTSVLELGQTGPGRYMNRNRYLVNNSNHLRAFYDFRKSGGTYNTIRYARNTGKPLSITPMIEQDLSKYMVYTEKEMWDFMNRTQVIQVTLSRVKAIGTGLCKQRVGHSPPGVVVRLRSW